mmetsp:Transcript_36929/g.80152  ORF Transcript_36929/g.80152 Transcript_36929/m.80152 type:complete len:419 (+) Transcript_36929:87-1343(+)
MIRKLFVPQPKASRFGRPPLYRRMCSADGGSAPTTRFLSATGKTFGGLQKVLGITSFIGIVCFVWQWQDRERPVRTIIDSKVRSTSTDVYIPRSELSDKLKVAVFSLKEDLQDYFISITGNREAGKSQLIRYVLDGYDGVLEVSLENDTPPRMAIRTILGVTDENAVARAFVEAESKLGRKPIILIDIHERVTNPNVLDAVSNFAKDFGYEKKLAKVLVVCSTAGTAAGITGDGRRIDFFVPQLTRKELDSADARRVFEIWHGKRVNDEDVQRIFDLVGGRIGNIKEILVLGRDGTMMGSLDKAIAWMKGKLLRDVRQYETIDRCGGFSPKGECLASWLAHEVARFPFDKCLPFKRVPLSPEDFAKTARDAHAHPIYFHPHIKGYCARSPFVHNQLRSVVFQPKSLRSPATAEPASSP